MAKIKGCKAPQHNIASEKFYSLERLYLPLSQHTGIPSVPRVNAGDTVKESELLAEDSGYISAKLHSPSAGKILEIGNYFHPQLKRAKALIVECKEEGMSYSAGKDNADLSREELIEIVRESGIVGMGGGAFPTHVKLRGAKKTEALIINGCECEPYLATDYRLIVENLKEIFSGIEILCRILQPKRVIFAIEEDSREAIKKINLFKSLRKFNLPSFSVSVLKNDYPQGAERQLIYSATRRKVPPGKLPMSIGCFVQNVATCYAIYEAVYLGKPLIERLVTFAGDALVSPKNLWLKIGTRIGDLFRKKILQFKHAPKKIVCGGPMMGVALASLDFPVVKASGGFLFFSRFLPDEEDNCLRCARCVDACPMELLPLEYAQKVKRGEYSRLGDSNIDDCIECGACAYVCPARIPLVHYIRIGKAYKQQT